jgi:hypothetical protein
MSLKIATLIAIIGTSIQLVMSVLVQFGFRYYVFSSLGWIIFEASLLIFFVVLFLKQQHGHKDD